LKKGDILSISLFVLLGFVLLYDRTRSVYLALNLTHPYIMGFFKVGILATFGEILAMRISKNDYTMPTGVLYRFIVWGLLGMVFVAVFELFGSGTKALLEKNLLPYTESTRPFFQAFYTSLLMNLIFAPSFMAFHKITDACIDMANGKIKNMFSIKFDDVLLHIDWKTFVNFVILKTIPFFWIPAHTVTFLLPSSYRVLMAALLSIALGVFLSLRRKAKG
jgi:hypothetical protein